MNNWFELLTKHRYNRFYGLSIKHSCNYYFRLLLLWKLFPIPLLFWFLFRIIWASILVLCDRVTICSSEVLDLPSGPNNHLGVSEIVLRMQQRFKGRLACQCMLKTKRHEKLFSVAFSTRACRTAHFIAKVGPLLLILMAETTRRAEVVSLPVDVRGCASRRVVFDPPSL